MSNQRVQKTTNSTVRSTFSQKALFISLLSCLTVLSIQEYKSSSSERLTDFPLGQQHKSVIDVLLVIGGVEINPGPQTVAEILGQLIVEAPNDIIKKTINKIRTDHDHQDNIKNLLKTGKDASTLGNLKETCVFLHDSSEDAFDDYLKEGVAETILYRINQLYPESCKTCTKTYSIHRLDKPQLQCYNCDKGSCPPCSEKYVQKFKSCGLNDVFWTCSTCTETRKEFINTEVNKLKKNRSKENTTKEPKTTNVAEVVNTSAVAEATTDVEEVIEVADEDEPEKVGDKEPSSPVEKPDSKSKLCRFYRNNKCKYGISGKGCAFHHAPPCPKILKHGLGGKSGCSVECDKFNPKMCRTSLARKECFRGNCTYKHLPNTLRKKESIKDKKVEVAQQPTKEKTAKPKVSMKPSNHSDEKNNSFLEEMKKELLLQVLQALGVHGSGLGQPNNNMKKSMGRMTQMPQTLMNPMLAQVPQPMMSPMMPQQMMTSPMMTSPMMHPAMMMVMSTPPPTQ